MLSLCDDLAFKNVVNYKDLIDNNTNDMCGFLLDNNTNDMMIFCDIYLLLLLFKP